jgi:hypothetical protein
MRTEPIANDRKRFIVDTLAETLNRFIAAFEKSRDLIHRAVKPAEILKVFFVNLVLYAFAATCHDALLLRGNRLACVCWFKVVAYKRKCALTMESRKRCTVPRANFFCTLFHVFLQPKRHTRLRDRVVFFLGFLGFNRRAQSLMYRS